MSDHHQDHEASDGFGLNDWKSLQSFVSIVLLLVAGIIWALKLEARIDSVIQQYAASQAITDQDIKNLNLQIQRGILPITAVRMEALEEKIKALTVSMDECIKRKER